MCVGLATAFCIECVLAKFDYCCSNIYENDIWTWTVTAGYWKPVGLNKFWNICITYFHFILLTRIGHFQLHNFLNYVASRHAEMFFFCIFLAASNEKVDLSSSVTSQPSGSEVGDVICDQLRPIGGNDVPILLESDSAPSLPTCGSSLSCCWLRHRAPSPNVTCSTCGKLVSKYVGALKVCCLKLSLWLSAD